MKNPMDKNMKSVMETGIPGLPTVRVGPGLHYSGSMICFLASYTLHGGINAERLAHFKVELT